VQHGEYESFVSLEHSFLNRLIANIKNAVTQATNRGVQMVIVTSPHIRTHLRKIVERFFPTVAVLSHTEITREANIMTIGMIEAR